MADRRSTVWCAAIIAGGACVLVASAGPLDPPAGPIAPSYPTLSQVEPRIDVATLASSKKAMHVISAPGSYYLTSSLAGTAGKDAISIEAGPVVLDLNGFTVTGSDSGIVVSAAVGAVTIRSGAVRGCGSDGILTDPATGSVIIESVHAQANGGAGIRTSNAVITGCVASANGGSGIVVGAASTLSDCTSRANTGSGFEASDSCTLRNCSGIQNASSGLVGMYRVLAEGCTFSRNTLNGALLALECQVQSCNVGENGLNQVLATGQCRIIGNTIAAGSSSTGDGIGIDGDGCTIEHNSLTRPIGPAGGRGIHVMGEHSFIGSNRVSKLFANPYVLDLKNSWGPLVDAYQAGNVGALSGGAVPSANFIH